MTKEIYMQGELTATKATKTDAKKFKTEMCKNWIEAGTCRYGNKCQFSHGEQELIGKKEPSDQKYKTKSCESFSDTRFCPYGNRCLFRHEDRQFEEVHSYFYVSKLLTTTYVKTEVPAENCLSAKRLNIFAVIDKEGGEEKETQENSQLNSSTGEGETTSEPEQSGEDSDFETFLADSIRLQEERDLFSSALLTIDDDQEESPIKSEGLFSSDFSPLREVSPYFYQNQMNQESFNDF